MSDTPDPFETASANARARIAAANAPSDDHGQRVIDAVNLLRHHGGEPEVPATFKDAADKVAWRLSADRHQDTLADAAVEFLAANPGVDGDDFIAAIQVALAADEDAVLDTSDDYYDEEYDDDDE